MLDEAKECIAIHETFSLEFEKLERKFSHASTIDLDWYYKKVKAKFLREGTFDVQNLITIPHAKLLRKLGELTSEQMEDLEDVLLVWLGFESEEDED